ncbi:altronate dehydratase family protein [Paenibacillus glycanilyticus]|uniref:UxaA family hydrolase n=1 Tax=Paenibacillus glycanilyticus TaxID=126569 RepID=UPI00203CD1A3|nr:altronate dehydratase family protein [Paenibacillus glycanilyticus]MCM3628539.1 altronate dehydratase family protein [Paenibacillus glycanilyticus]
MRNTTITNATLLHPKDDVVIALRDIEPGEIVRWPAADGSEQSVSVTEAIPRGHKIIIQPVAEGVHVHKFGYSIGVAKEDIPSGRWVHTHNLRTGLGEVLEYEFKPKQDSAPEPAAAASSTAPKTFKGYVREDGEVGIRNEIWIINTVGCINKTCETLAKLAGRQFEGQGIDGVYHFPHPYGCSQLGDDLTATQKLLSALVRHGNAAGVLVIGLGCENNQIDDFKKAIGDYNPDRVKFLKSQEVEDELEEGLKLIEELVEYAGRFKRRELPLAKLRIGLKCGGSDGFSGITANPLVGRIADAITAAGGTALLTEVPEMFGAETILMDRAANEQVFHEIVNLVNDFKGYFIRHGQEIYENPSPGNKDGGITTLEEKSLGCTQKGGHAIVTDVLPYGEPSRKPGLNLVQAPGNDLVSVTALSAAGAHVVLFTTGRGTPFGGPVPTVKIATNTQLAERKKNWIDFNAGQLIEGKRMDELQEELLEQIVELASGDRETNNERNGFREIAIFKDGVIL